MNLRRLHLSYLFILFAFALPTPGKTPSFQLIPSEKFLFNSFVDCNMAEAWIGDTLRIFPGKIWGGFALGLFQQSDLER